MVPLTSSIEDDAFQLLPLAQLIGNAIGVTRLDVPDLDPRPADGDADGVLVVLIVRLPLRLDALPHPEPKRLLRVFIRPNALHNKSVDPETT